MMFGMKPMDHSTAVDGPVVSEGGRSQSTGQAQARARATKYGPLNPRTQIVPNKECYSLHHTISVAKYRIQLYEISLNPHEATVKWRGCVDELCLSAWIRIRATHP